jgi:hypothetical protein
MRYYDITLTKPGSSTPFRQWSSQYQGRFDPAALNVMFDMPVLPYATPGGGQSLTIEGMSLQDLAQAQQFAGMNLTLRAGMQAGLPLANPKQAGTIIAGQVFQSFGNWVGTEMTLDLVLYPSIYTPNNPGNFVLNWRKGQPLGDALKQMLSIVYPNTKIDVSISADLVNNYDNPHVVHTLEDIAYFVGNFTEETFHNRVDISFQAGRITIRDKTYKPAPIQLAFTDFVGQPTWIEANIMQVTTVMRADIEIGSIIQMPQGMQNAPGIVGTSAASMPSSLKYQSTFQNSFQVVELRQIGNFRAPDGAAWVTIFNCVQNP